MNQKIVRNSGHFEHLEAAIEEARETFANLLATKNDGSLSFDEGMLLSLVQDFDQHHSK